MSVPAEITHKIPREISRKWVSNSKREHYIRASRNEHSLRISDDKGWFFEILADIISGCLDVVLKNNGMPERFSNNARGMKYLHSESQF